VDNLCHTLVGAAMAQAGLKDRTALGTATLVIGANLPDIDVVSTAWADAASLAFRRGWTHGIPAVLVLPFMLTGIMIAWDRLARRRGAAVGGGAVRPRELLLLSAISIISHPILDYMNNYGMRWLMPFRNTWFYGDTLFIVDPWLWLMLAGGVLLVWLRERERRAGSKAPGAERETEAAIPDRRSAYADRAGNGQSRAGRRGGPRATRPARRPAQVALALAAAYIAVMLAAGLVVRRVVARRIVSAGFEPVKIMVSPVLANPFRRFVVFDTGERYHFGTFDWLPDAELALEGRTIPKGDSDPSAAAATTTAVGRAFLSWARFPFFVVDREARATVVHIGDARYTVDPTDSWAAVSVRLPVGR
jgi:inner membrane protein